VSKLFHVKQFFACALLFHVKQETGANTALSTMVNEILTLFADAEFLKDRPQDFFHIHPTQELAQRM